MANGATQHTEAEYYSQHQGDSAPDGFKGLGYYRRTDLENVVSTFIIAYTGEDKALVKVPKYEVEFWAQKGLQEFSFDILHSEKSIEIELGSALTFPLPQDYISLLQVSQIGDDGSKNVLLRKRKSGNPMAPVQDDDFEYTFGDDGSLILASKSDTITKFQDSTNPANITQSAQDYYYSNYNNDNFSYFNKRYGGIPEEMNAGGTYVLDEPNGLIYFDGTFASRGNELIVLDYISDGLGADSDLKNIYIPKLAEEALYSYMLYNLAKVRPASAQLAPLYKKEASAKMRNAKIRLSNYDLKELAQVLRGKAKWIKH